MMKKIIITIAYFIFIFSCYSQSENITEYKISKDNFEQGSILNLLFSGNYAASLKTVAWKPYPMESVPISDDGFCHTNVDTVLFYNSDTVNYALVILRTMQHTDGYEESCVGCPPTMGLALFVENNSSWSLSNFDRSICSIGQGGFLPEKKIYEVGKNRMTLSLKEETIQNFANEYFFSLDSYDFGNEVFSYTHSCMVEIGEESFYQETFLDIIPAKIEEEYAKIKLTSTLFDVGDEMAKEIKTTRKLYNHNGRIWIETGFYR